MTFIFVRDSISDYIVYGGQANGYLAPNFFLAHHQAFIASGER